jgi:PPM family protein phosphatase
VRFDAYSASNSIGAGHSENQDSYLTDMSTMLFAVADGVGGYEGGKEASELAVGALRNKAFEVQNEVTVKSALSDINEQLLYTAKSRNFRNMGTTVSLAKILPDFQTGRGGKILTANVGDTPILLFQNSGTGFGSESDYLKIYTDDSFRDKMPGSMWAIVQYLGMESKNEIDIHAQISDYQTGDIVLICSDGISDNLLTENTYSRSRSAGDIGELVRKTGSARKIVEQAMQAGIKSDDMTAVLIFL